MAVIQGGTTGALVEVGAAAAVAAHVTLKPVPFSTAGGHYQVNHRCALVATQAANSRLFEVRNASASILVVPTKLTIKWIQTAAHTAAIEDSLDIFKVTGFSAVDTTNTVTPVASVKRTTGMLAPASSVTAIRGVTIAGAAAGMTGGTLVKDTSAVGQLPQWLLLAEPTAATIVAQIEDFFTHESGTHPFVFAQNEGFEIENRVLLGAAAGSSVYIDFEWAEVPAY